MALAPNTGFGLLNPGTTTPSPAAPTTAPAPAPPSPSPTVGDLLGSFQNYNAFTGPPLPGSAGAVAAAGGPPVPPVQPPTQNLQGLVNGFPGVSNALALEQEGLSQLDANLNQQRQQAIINFGDPALAQLAGFGLDPQAGAFAQQNYLSGNATLARLDKAHQLAAQGVINTLASHGLLNSGDLGYQEGQENQNYGNNVYDAQQSVLQQLASLYNNYLTSRYGLENNANQAQLDALTSYLSNPDAYASLVGAQQATQAPTAPTATKTKAGKVSGPADALSRYLANNG